MKRVNQFYCALAVAGAITFQHSIHQITLAYQDYMHNKETSQFMSTVEGQEDKISELSDKVVELSGNDISRISSDVALNARIKYLISHEVDTFNRKPGTKYPITEKEIYDIIGKESCGRICSKSNKNAIGLMQVLLSTADSEYGIKSAAELFKPENNIHVGTDYYGRMKNMFGSITLAMAAYNAGPGAVTDYGGVPPFPETIAYVSGKPASVASKKQPEKHLQKGDKKLVLNTRVNVPAKKDRIETSLDSPHYVESGETLFAIGRRYNIAPDKIANHNHIPSNYKVKEGQLIKIPFKRNG